MIKAITFDLWNTIFTNRFYTEQRLSWFTQFLYEKGIYYSKNEIKDAFKIAFDVSKRNFEENFHLYTRNQIQKVLEYLKIDLIERDIDKINNEFEEVMLKDPPSLKKGVKKTLEELSSEYKIGLISNTGITPGRIIIKVFQDYNI